MHDARQRLTGVLICLSLLALCIGGISPWVLTNGVLGVMSSLNANLAPLHLLAAFLCGLFLAALGAWRWARFVVLAALLLSSALVARHLVNSAPLAADREADLKVLFFNILQDNQYDALDLAAQIVAADADIVVLAESEGLREGQAVLQAAYPHVAVCEGQCGLRVYFREAPAHVKLHKAAAFYDRKFIAAKLGFADVTVIAAHMLKPWIEEQAVNQKRHLVRLVNRTQGPVVVVGDFNAAPWAASLAALTWETQLRLPRRPIGSWPAKWGDYGVPIDYVLTGREAQLLSLSPFGEGLGSNHRGFVAEIVLPEG
ncbi:hypothetical protein ACMU_11275 [Actibacterium mucosum KCTC 23349]|uniref:Endonuclease/exonuclease/phosphatase domain-containing protein n=1 Tax=Actibacterium mucosum KCTC 23349 TaxID=1454373 RepID=A0A037ZI28_9RHOB|nr:endonuclease/exonuclease/phosphatase family protein [Actibacterium mucosum]KAJ55274.1 hypothetical protein ACMU_11275 [Actibacterium mucosum KCTC 23349]